MKRILINSSYGDELRVALVDGAKLYDFDTESPERTLLKGSIYKATVSRIESSLDAAFVNFGSDRHGFLPLKDLSKEFYKKDKKGKYVCTLEEGQEAARLCAIMILSQAKKACGNLEMINKCIKLGGFVNTDDQFSDHALVMDGASKLMISILEDKGWHARFAVGASSLPLNMAVEVDAIFELQN